MNARIRCAVYTRKSSEEGLDQSFNSLDAQREACESFIQSQKHEGWTLIPTKYDDGGFSGGNIERPALKKLMADIAEGKVNTVVVYKVDRLTRCLADFAKIIEQFDSKGVNFVSVTQQFNTTTSMGRLTLNVLLSFAQFEREVTGERIRDKIAASKAKGMWMGGRVPLGYDLRERRIYINPSEAERVREIFRLYLKVKTVPALLEELCKSGIRTKIRIENGKKSGAKLYSRGALYKLLRNHLYVGEIKHNGSAYPGEHQAILDRSLWDDVQKLLDENCQGSRKSPRATSGSMLQGLLFSESGVRYIPTSAHKKGRRYCYYTSQAVLGGRKQKACAFGRLPSAALEAAVSDRIAQLLGSPVDLLAAVQRPQVDHPNYDRLLKLAKLKAARWGGMPHKEKAGFIRSLLHRVVVHEGSIELAIKLESLIEVLEDRGPQPAEHPFKPTVFSMDTPFRHVPQGSALKLVIGNIRPESSQSREAVPKALARARDWYELILSGKFASLAELARRQGVTPRYVKKIFPLAFLGPVSVELLLNEPRSLASLMGNIPLTWEEQRRHLAVI
ncbi:recombinase family protein [Occallatibacter savannae]|uniref:recombinase family protein n=1 Tax=Occallatibacter savannae TaxID=1002691 RepID=UPI000D68EA68|nr:recombinase family protein [Occallatibacter savannae]